MKKNYIILIALFISFHSLAQNKQIQWIHGFGDTEDIWQVYAPYFGDGLNGTRQASSLTASYATQSGIVTGASTLRSRNLTLTTPNSNRILIGHSMGGVVAREYVRQNGTNFAGSIITIASPHKGAVIAQNLRNGNLDATVDNAIGVLVGPVDNDPNGTLFSTGFQFLFGGLNNTISAFGQVNVNAYWYAAASAAVIMGGVGIINNGGSSNQQFVSGFLVPMFQAEIEFADSFDNSSAQTITDLMPGSTALNRLGSSIPIPTATIVCEETSKAPLRAASSALFPPEEEPLHFAVDDQVIGLVNQARKLYITGRIFNDVKKWVGFWNYNKYHDRARAWRSGQNYIENQFEADYASLMGATRRESYTYSYQYLDCGDPGEPTIDQITPGGTDGCVLRTATATGFRNVTEKSDGLIPVSAQTIEGNSPNRVYTAMEVNHLEVGNNPNMTGQIERIFDTGDSPLFRVARK